MEWETVIGLEVHAQITSESKLFSDASTNSSTPNSNVSVIDAAMPGTLPCLNKRCIEQAVKTGIAIGSKINQTSSFDRKNYFYPDLPSGYQITQFYHPIAVGGHVYIHINENKDSHKKKIRIHHLHIEQDAGKSIRDLSPAKTHIDLNRAGVPLMEIVSEPDMRSPQEAVLYASKLRQILMYIEACDGNMEDGSFRCDANVSVRPFGESKLGTRCEIKNLNSMKFLSQAIIYESTRQIKLIQEGGQVIQQTRTFDISTGKTVSMRNKEDATDYRYFPEPDLPSVKVDRKFIDSIILPELPDIKIQRYIESLGLSYYEAEILCLNNNIAKFFESIVNKHDPKLLSKWITIELFARLNRLGISIKDSPVSPEDFSELLSFIESNKISSRMAKDVLDKMFETKQNSSDIIKKFDLLQITDNTKIEEMVVSVLESNPDKIEQYKQGKTRVISFLIGQVMKLSDGSASPQMVSTLMKQKLDDQ